MTRRVLIALAGIELGLLLAANCAPTSTELNPSEIPGGDPLPTAVQEPPTIPYIVTNRSYVVAGSITDGVATLQASIPDAVLQAGEVCYWKGATFDQSPTLGTLTATTGNATGFSVVDVPLRPEASVENIPISLFAASPGSTTGRLLASITIQVRFQSGTRNLQVRVLNAPGCVVSNQVVPLEARVEGGTPVYQLTWSSGCGGTFNPAIQNMAAEGTFTTEWTAPPGLNQSCDMRLRVADAEGSSMETITVINIREGAPQITMLGANPLVAAAGSGFTDPGADAVDACGRILTVVPTSTVNPNNPGAYTIIYNAEDAAGNNAAPQTRNVTIQASVAFAVPGTSVAEGDVDHPVAVQLTFAGGGSTHEAINVTVQDAGSGSATSAGDYSAFAPCTATFPPGSVSGATANCTLHVIGDSSNEPDETVALIAAGVTGPAVIGAQSSHTVTIQNNDPPPTVTLSGTTSIGENVNTANITATLSSTSSTNVAVNLTLNGTSTATLNEDYTLSSLTITIPAGSLSASSVVTTKEDTIDEPDELVVLDIDSVVGGTESGVQQATVTITDNDAAPQVTLGVSAGSMAETGGSVNLTAMLVGTTSSQNVTVNLAYSGTATGGGLDYAGAGSIVIPQGGTSAAIPVAAISDGYDEENETIIVDIDSVVNGTESGVQTATVTITDDDDPPLVFLTLAAGTAAEGGSDTLTANLNSLSGRDVTVTLAFSGTASGSDYSTVPAGNTIIIPSGSSTANMVINAIQDLLNEADETLIIDIQSVANGGEMGVQTVTLTIPNDDPVPTLAISDVSLSEGDGGTTPFNFTVSLNAASGRTILVDYATADGTATIADGDYIANSGTLTFDPGETAKTITVVVDKDNDVEPDEVFSVNLTLNPPYNVYVNVGHNPGVGTILNDD